MQKIAGRHVNEILTSGLNSFFLYLYLYSKLIKEKENKNKHICRLQLEHVVLLPNS